MYDSFSDFIFYEKYDENVKKIAIRKFLEALLLNGIFKLNDLNCFLSKTINDVAVAAVHGANNHRHHQHHNDSSDDSTFSSSEDDSDMDIEIEVRPVNDRTITIGEKILLSNPNYLNDYFPLTLKNLCRIYIKNCLVDYSERTIDCLDLPVVAKKFLLFDDKIDEVMKLTKNFSVF